MLFRGEAGGEWVPLGLGFGLRWGGGKGEEMKHQTPSESPTGVGDHRGLVLGISPPPPEHRGTISEDSDDVDDEPPLGGSGQAVEGGFRQAIEGGHRQSWPARTSAARHGKIPTRCSGRL